VLEGEGDLMNEKGEELLLKAGDFTLVNPDEKHQYRNKGDKPFKMIFGIPEEYEQYSSYHSSLPHSTLIFGC